ncbi:MAG: phosphoribosyltransferase family protein [Bacteroidales bacterium]|nr:phosphoribosyltransferase family protein [Bacteroidales bacterium]
MNSSSCKREVVIPGYGSITLTTHGEIENLEDFFLMAVRKNNKKRNFLFVSQLLAKHIPIPPQKLFDSCATLCTDYAREKGLSKDESNRFTCKQATLVIGFAETATAMGHSVFDCFNGECYYVHTTREKVDNYEFAFEFVEEHCHAPEQLFFLEHEEWIASSKEIIIVDDEVTTGKTIRNMIEQIEARYPGKSYSVITFLDWRNNENLQAYQNFRREKEIDIRFFSFVKGEINHIDIKDNTLNGDLNPITMDYHPEDKGWNFHYCKVDSNIKTGATNGMNIFQREQLQESARKIARYISSEIKFEKRSIIGCGEFMYFPMCIARELAGKNYCNAITRSPIIANNDVQYGVKSAFEFTAPTDPNRKEFLYNINTLECEEVILILENSLPIEQLYPVLQRIDSGGYKSKHVLFVKGQTIN